MLVLVVVDLTLFAKILTIGRVGADASYGSHCIVGN